MFEKIRPGTKYKVQPPEDLYDLVGELYRQYAADKGAALGYSFPMYEQVLVSVSYSYDGVHWTREVLYLCPEDDGSAQFEYDYFEGQRYIMIHWIMDLDEIDKKIGGK